MNTRMIVGAVALLTAVATVASTAPTDASWVDSERATSSVTAGTVAAPATSCEGRNGAPNRLWLSPGTGGVDIAEFVITLSTDDAVSAWDSGATPEGFPLLSSGDPVVVPADTRAVAWGITGGWSMGYAGEVSVAAVAPGGWVSDTVTYDWTIEFDWIGLGYGTCTAP
ncbi:hypothetical protein [Microbacterium halophytorum]|uniref:hypothetical protein n=1 Tax=Microbacterium halophytorum TaxID=2067568 RepID=UPI001319D280|nr:hypothetical protein [Microbacterium halophytorum]